MSPLFTSYFLLPALNNLSKAGAKHCRRRKCFVYAFLRFVVREEAHLKGDVSWTFGCAKNVPILRKRCCKRCALAWVSLFDNKVWEERRLVIDWL